MANELKAALDQVKVDMATLTNVQRVQLGQPMSSLSEATQGKCVACVYLMNGSADNDTYKATSEHHKLEMSFYWPLSPENVEVVEQNMATMWDVIMVKFFGADADRNLTETATIALVSGEDGGQPYSAGYQDVAGKLHRVMSVPLEIILDTHSV